MLELEIGFELEIRSEIICDKVFRLKKK